MHEEENSSYFQNGKILVDIDGSLKDNQTIKATILRQKVGYIFQSPLPLPLTIEQNVAFGLKIHGIKDYSRVEKALKNVALWDEVKKRLNKSALNLSLGQQQRLSIARVLVLKPKFYYLMNQHLYSIIKQQEK